MNNVRDHFVTNLEGEIGILRALVERRIDDLDRHGNPNLDHALKTVGDAVRTIDFLMQTHVDLTKKYGAMEVGKSVARRIINIIYRTLPREQANELAKRINNAIITEAVEDAEADKGN